MHPVSFDMTLICKSTVMIYTCTNEDKFVLFLLLDENLETINTVHLHVRCFFFINGNFIKERSCCSGVQESLKSCRIFHLPPIKIMLP